MLARKAALVRKCPNLDDWNMGAINAESAGVDAILLADGERILTLLFHL